MNNFEKKETDITAQRIRELKGKESQEAFAAGIHMSQSSVSKALNGTPPSATMLKMLAEKYEVSVDWLLGLSDRKSSRNVPSAVNMTYADAIAVLHGLYMSGAIKTGYNFNECKDSSIINVQDLVLQYLLSARNKVEELDSNMQEYWYQNIAEKFADKQIIKWDQKIEHEFNQYMAKNPEDKDIIAFIDLIKDNFNGELDNEDNGLPFK